MTKYTRHVFEEVRVYGGKHGACMKCGANARRSKKFWQTINPFNDKSRKEIHAEIVKQREAWDLEPLYHVRCE